LHVFAKLFEDRLDGGLEAKAFAGREIGGEDNVLVLVGYLSACLIGCNDFRQGRKLATLAMLYDWTAKQAGLRRLASAILLRPSDSAPFFFRKPATALQQ
jgi:hypothetical protein